jgi:hypothetical protein
VTPPPSEPGKPLSETERLVLDCCEYCDCSVQHLKDRTSITQQAEIIRAYGKALEDIENWIIPCKANDNCPLCCVSSVLKQYPLSANSESGQQQSGEGSK